MSDLMDKKNQTGISRRDFLIGGTALVAVVGAAGVLSIGTVNAAHIQEFEGNAWVTIADSGAIEIIFPSTELGQGSSTALPMILAEELDANWDDVVVKQLDKDDRAFGNAMFGGVLYTAGSTAVINYFDPLRKAGAQVRAVLVQTAALHWGVAPESLSVAESVITDPATGKALTYGEIVVLPEMAGAKLPDAETVPLKARGDYKLIGSDLGRLDIPAKSRGAYEFGIDVRVPDMLYAVVERAPVEGETATTIDKAETLATDRVVDVVELPDGIAVVAETLEAAFAGRGALSVTWSETSPARNFDSDRDLANYEAALGDPSQKPAVWAEAGDADAALAKAEKRLSATYLSDYAYHAQFEPMSAVAHVTEGGKKAEAWIGSQSQTLSHYTVRDTLGIENDAITIHMMPMGGSFGRRTELVQPYLRDALLASKATGRPVKVIWSREDDVKAGAMRPAAAQQLTAGLASDGSVSGWTHRVAAPSVIQYFNPVRWKQVAPKDVISVKGSEAPFYELSDKRADHVITERGARLAPWRGIGAAYTSFAVEAFMDELAVEAGVDAIEFRMKLLAENPRGQALLNRVAEMADWGNKRPDTGLGIAFAGYGKSMAAGIAEIALDRDSGQIQTKNFWTAVDAGLVVSPKNTEAQVEGGIIFGVSSALKERATIKGGQVEQSNYYDYEIATIYDIPEIHIDIADVDAHPTQVGELGTPMVAGAIANAFYALTGKRIRHMPFTPDRVLAVLQA